MSNDSLTLIVIIFGAINLTVILSALFFYIHSKAKSRILQNKVNHYGDSAEEKVINYLKKGFPKATIMKDVYLKTPNGLTEIDCIFICNRGIFIIEVKSHNGYIVTDTKLWTQHWKNKVIRFHNPIKQNSVHKNALEAVLRKRQSLASLPIYSVTVFTSNTVDFSKKVKDVIKLGYLSTFIKKKNPDRRMTRETIKRVENFISSNMETRRHRQLRHKKQIYENNMKKRAYRINKQG